MSEGGLPPGMSFPQKVHTEDEDFVIELDESHMGGPHDGFGMDDRSRCKRRKRCGQCGPCQVKENCMKCHFCIRKDVLKQTCIYRKCVYLRSKPKPYSRPHQSPQGRSVSPPRDVVNSLQVKSPSSVHSGVPFPESGVLLPDARPEGHPFFPSHLPQQNPAATGPAVTPNNGYLSPLNPVMERTPSLPNAAGNNNMNMQMNMSPHPHVQNNATSPPVPKSSDHTSPIIPQPVNSPMAAVPGIPTSITTCSNMPHIPAPMPHVGPTIPSVMPQMNNGSITGMPHLPAMGGVASFGERSMNDFRTPDQFTIGPHHPHAHFPPVPPHMTHREPTGIFEHSRLSHMNFNHPSNPMDSLGRGPNDSSCMYHPGLPYSMPGHFQPSGPSFLTGAAEMNPFRSNFLNSFPPGYSYPPDRYREGFGPLPFSRLGMSTSTSFPQYPGQTGGYGVGNSLSQQYYNSQHGCPKNGSRPPVSPSIDDVKVIQEGYNNNEISQNNSVSEMCNPKSSDDGAKKISDSGCRNGDEFSFPSLGFWRKDGKIKSEKLDTFPCSAFSQRMEPMRPWEELYLPHAMMRNDLVSPQSSRSLHFDPLLSPWYSPRRDDVRSRASTSTLSSDFESEVIGIDDQQVNALIRSDGCNSIEIELDNRSVSSSDASPRKLASRSSTVGGFTSLDKTSYFQPIARSVSSDCMSEEERENSFKKAFNLFKPGDSYKLQNKIFNPAFKNLFNSDMNKDENVATKPTTSIVQTRSFFKDSVCIQQDLGEEGTLQLELPGNKVYIENVVFSDELLSNSSNVEELKSFIKGGHSYIVTDSNQAETA
ncbi:uncharacterized protein LOC128231741 [Mya arenaria]|uniref:uncharacterized protein LOC128231741 n=1 Tax=Mya arenaria TaxID=6604 RepID=UPI0022E160BE|nr:uncharacterized protein LOC128231741 [Mya arenaria]